VRYFDQSLEAIADIIDPWGLLTVVKSTRAHPHPLPPCLRLLCAVWVSPYARCSAPRLCRWRMMLTSTRAWIPTRRDPLRTVC